MIIFAFCARGGPLLLVDLFFPNIVLANHVLGVSVLCIFKPDSPRKTLYRMHVCAPRCECLRHEPCQLRAHGQAHGVLFGRFRCCSADSDFFYTTC